MRCILIKPMIVFIMGFFLYNNTIANSTKLLRHPDISEKQITFVYGGDIWIADKNGEDAKRLTTFPGEETFPHFSPDGNHIAFSGQYDGNTDVYVVSINGDAPKRLTWHPSSDNVIGWTPDGKVLFTSDREQTPQAYADLLYTIDINGSFPTQYMKPRIHNGQISPDGKTLAYRRNTPWESEWRNYRGGQANPIRILNLETFDLEKIPWDGSNDISPVWIDDVVYFLSDRDFAMNIWSYNYKTKELVQETFYKEFDCKNLEAGKNAIIYEYGGDLYVKTKNEESHKKINVEINADFPWLRPHWTNVSKYIRTMEISPNGKRAIFEARGEIFTVPEKEGDIRNLTNSSGSADRSPAWSPDGKKLCWFSDASGDYKLIIADQYGKKIKAISFSKPTFYYAPQWSPDSKFISFSDTDRVLWFVNTETNEVIKIDDEGFSNPERVIVPKWSPDSKWIAYAKRLQNEYSAIFIYSLDQKKSFQITDGMSECKMPAWDKGGKYLYFLSSTNYGLNTGWLDMTSYERPVDYSIYLIVLSNKDKNPLEAKSDEEKENEKDEKKEGKKAKDKNTKEEDEGVKVQIDIQNIQNRIVNINVPSRFYKKLSSAEEGTIFYTEAKEDQTGLTLHKYILKDQESKKLIDNASDFLISFNGKKILYSSNGSYFIASTSEDIVSSKEKIQTSNLEMKLDPMLEYKQLFREAWRYQRDYFYVKNVHGLDMDWAYKTYSEWVSHVRHRSDMNYLLDIFSGETAIGHSFVSGGDYPKVDRIPIGLLGADIAIENNAYRIKKIYTGENWNPDIKAPLSKPGLEVKEGEYILAVNGLPVNVNTNFYSYFEQTANKQTFLTVSSTPEMSTAREIKVIPVKNENGLRRVDWIEENRKKVDELSNGQLAYVWLPNTGFGGYTNFNRYYFAQKHKKGAIIDERFNHGGSAADYIIDMLDREIMGYFNNAMGNKTPQTSPAAGIWGPKVMIINECAGSGGDYMPYMFKKREVGTLVGTRTWGGLVGIWDVPLLIDGGRITAPRGGFYDTDGKWAVENEGVAPDIEVEQEPKLIQQGRDPQLEAAVEIALEKLKTESVELKSTPADPIRSIRPE